MPLLPFKEKFPTIDPSSWIAPTAYVIGESRIGSEVSIFFNAVIRGDINPILVGDGTNIQEGALLHTSTGLGPCTVGRNVTIGHGAIIHGCSIQNHCIIGMGSTILDGAIIESECLIGANSLVTMNTVIPSGSLALGSPAKVVRKLTDAEIQEINASARHYRELGAEYKLRLS